MSFTEFLFAQPNLEVNVLYGAYGEDGFLREYKFEELIKTYK